MTRPRVDELAVRREEFRDKAEVRGTIHRRLHERVEAEGAYCESTPAPSTPRTPKTIENPRSRCASRNLPCHEVKHA